jgi:hypothetical protein
MFPTFPIESNCRSIRHACRRKPNHRRTRQVSALFCVIATEVSNLLPLFYRSLYHPHSLPSIRASDPWLLHAGMLASFHTHRASLRIGLGCLHSPRCRTPAGISGKDFPLPLCTGSNQLSLTCFFLPSLFTSFPAFSFLSALHASRSRGHHHRVFVYYYFFESYSPGLL